MKSSRRISHLTLAVLTLAGLLLPVASEATFAVSGSDADKATWNKMLQQCSNASPSFKALVNKINSGAKTVTIKLVRNVKPVVFDQRPDGGPHSNEVDLTDIEDLAKLDPPKVVDRCQLIAHILEERWQYACGATFRAAHLAGIDAENRWRADRGYTDRINRNPVPGGWIGHGPSSDRKKACHFWTDGDTTYDPVPGERTETGVIARQVEPGLISVETDPDSAVNQDVTELPQALGGGQTEVGDLSVNLLVEIGPPVVTGEFRYADLTILSFEGTAPEAPLPVPPFTTGPNDFSLDPTLEQRGILNLDNGQLWLTYHGSISNDIFPPGSALGTYSMLTAVLDPADLLVAADTVELLDAGTRFQAHTVAALFDGEEIASWSHYPEADCNANGVQDVFDIAEDPTLDDGFLCGAGAGNHYLDACDCGDCNGNGMPDVLDLESGLEVDCDWNGIPDSCDLAAGREVPSGCESGELTPVRLRSSR